MAQCVVKVQELIGLSELPNLAITGIKSLILCSMTERERIVSRIYTSGCISKSCGQRWGGGGVDPRKYVGT